MIMNWLLDKSRVAVGKPKLCKGCRQRIHATVGQIQQGSLPCPYCGYKNEVVFFLRKDKKA